MSRQAPRKVGLADLANETWILPTTNSLQSRIVIDGFRQLGLNPPKIAVDTFSVQLRMDLIGDGHYVGTLPRSVVKRHSNRWSLKALPIALPAHEFPLAAVTLKNRILNPAAGVFMEHARAVSQMIENS